MKNVKKIVTLLMALVMIISLSACGKQADFDAKGYVQSFLDAKYHQEYKAYAKIIDMSEKEAKEQMVKEFNDSLKQQLTMAGLKATDEETEEYLKLEADIRSTIKYEVKEAKKDDDDNFTVDVEVTPLDAYTLMGEQFPAKLQDAVNNGTGEDGYMRVFLDCVKESFDNAQELDPVTFTFNVTYEEKDNKRLYSIDENEVMDFDLTVTNQK